MNTRKNSSIVRANGNRIRRDRQTNSHTRESLVQLARENGFGLSLSTLQRAENSENIQPGTLENLASLLGANPNSYMQKTISFEVSAQPDLSGRWNSYYVEDQFDLDPYLVFETIDLEKFQDEYQGRISANVHGELREETIKDAYMRRDMFVGSTLVNGWTLPAGYGQFQLLCSRADNWLDGVASWYDADADKIEFSRNIWVRMDHKDHEKFLQQAKRLMDIELEFFRNRRSSNF